MASTDTSAGTPLVAKLGLGLLLVIGLVRTVLLGATGGITLVGATIAGSPHPATVAVAGAKVWLVGIDVLTVLLVARLLTRESRSIRELYAWPTVGRSVLYVLVGVVAVFFALSLGSFVGNFLIYYGAPTATDTVVPPIWLGVVRAVLTPITVAVAEETLFRGYLIPRLQQHVGRAGAVIVSALLAATQAFALNLGNVDAMWAGFLGAFVVALAFGALYLWQKRITPLIIVHWFFEVVTGVAVLVAAVHG